ncbi:hypothetical protein HMPREF3291_07065 [Bacillus sp. HMSC76G11]|uniref:DUF948 domain-containing protein n=1 Tax=Metabacillus idriensis TaxID=324768 RepID=UPI0008AA156D|nr:DUF948 domain-containing protein [Metabacillus idriensis]OHR70462.1 hypothetical protein HMPREF3291_07065 [Bacillus sp. HMSC76G11]
MAIVYISIALVVCALIYLGVSAFRTFKKAQPALQDLQETANRIQKQTEGIQTETTKLSATQEKIMSDVEYKKQTVQTTIEIAKETPETIKGFKEFLPSNKEESAAHRVRG